MSWQKLCAVDDIPCRGAKRVIGLADVDVALFRLADERVVALENRCPHKGGPLVEGMISGDKVICPFHNKKVGLFNGCIGQSKKGAARQFKIKIEQGFVWGCGDA